MSSQFIKISDILGWRKYNINNDEENVLTLMHPQEHWTGFINP
jgi:hypothetical protein